MNRVRSLIQRTALATRRRGTTRRGALAGGILIGVALLGGFWLISNVASTALGFGPRLNPPTLPTPAAGQDAPDTADRPAPQPSTQNNAPQAAPEGRRLADRPDRPHPERGGPPAGPRHDHPPVVPRPQQSPMSVAPDAWWTTFATPFAWLGNALQWLNTAATVMFGVLCLGLGATLLRPRGTSEPPRD